MKRYFKIQSELQPTCVVWLHSSKDVPEFVVNFINSIRFLLENDGFRQILWSYSDCCLYVRKDFGDKYIVRIDFKH